MDDVTWAALTLSLTALGAIYTWVSFRRRGLAAGLRGAGLTLLPLAAYLTNTLQMFTEIGDSVVDWAAGLVFRPSVWVGVVLAGLGVLLFGVGNWLGGRTEKKVLEQKRGPTGTRARDVTGDRKQELPTDERAAGSAEDDDLADIEAILKRRGIT